MRWICVDKRGINKDEKIFFKPLDFLKTGRKVNAKVRKVVPYM